MAAVHSKKSISQLLSPDQTNGGGGGGGHNDSLMRRSSISLKETTLGVINKLIRGYSYDNADIPAATTASSSSKPINKKDEVIGVEKSVSGGESLVQVGHLCEDNKGGSKPISTENMSSFPLRKELSCNQIRNLNDVELGLVEAPPTASTTTTGSGKELGATTDKPKLTLKQRRQSFFSRQKSQRSMSDDKNVPPDSTCPIYAKRNVVLRRKSILTPQSRSMSVSSVDDDAPRPALIPTMTALVEATTVSEDESQSSLTNPPDSLAQTERPANISDERKNSLIHEIRVLSPRNSLRGIFYSSSVISVRNSSPNDECDADQSKNDNNGYIQRMKTSADFNKIRKFCIYFKWTSWMSEREDNSLFLFSPENKLRRRCLWLADHPYFDYVVLIFISLNCITLAMERPKIPPYSREREFLSFANYAFTLVFGIEMLVKVIAKGLFYGRDAYFHNGWNIMDGSLVGISLLDIFLSFFAQRSPRIFGILRVFRLLRSLRPLRYVNLPCGHRIDPNHSPLPNAE